MARENKTCLATLLLLEVLLLCKMCIYSRKLKEQVPKNLKLRSLQPYEFFLTE